MKKEHVEEKRMLKKRNQRMEVLGIGPCRGPNQSVRDRPQSNLIHLKWFYLIKDNHPYYLKIKSYWTCQIGKDRGPNRPDSQH